MSDLSLRAMLNQLLQTPEHSEEESLLLAELARRFILSGTHIDANGAVHLGTVTAESLGVSFDSLTSNTANVTTLTVEQLNANNANVNAATVATATIDALTANSANLEVATANTANVATLRATTANVTTLTGNSISANVVTANTIILPIV